MSEVNYSTKSGNQGAGINAYKIEKYWMAEKSGDGRRVNHNHTGYVSRGDTGLFFHIENFPPTQPI
jgi:hypothetical protein